MYCKYCGSKLLDDNVKFCSNCGGKLIENDPRNNYFSYSSSNFSGLLKFDSIKVKYICANIGLIIIYFLDWVKIKGSFGLFSDLYLADYGIKTSISPQYIVELFLRVKSIASYGSDFSSNSIIPTYYNFLYVLLVMPILATAAILLLLLKKDRLSKISGLISSVIAILATICTIILVFQDNENIGARLGVFIALGVGITTIIFSDEIYNNHAKSAADIISPTEEDIPSESIEKELTDQLSVMDPILNNEQIVICGFCGYEDNEYGQKKCNKCGNELYYGLDNDESI